MTATRQHNARYIDGHWYLPVEDGHELREALAMVIWHAENLQRQVDHKPVGGLAESRAGFKKARDLLRSLEDTA